MHTMRRNVDINVLLFNNRIYGLTKGQYSPTSEFGKRHEVHADGLARLPRQPAHPRRRRRLHVRRAVDRRRREAPRLARASTAAAHRGTSFVEIYQDCNIFNHQAFFYASQKDTKPDERRCMLEHGKPLIFGKDRDRGIRRHDRHDMKLEVVQLGNGVTEDDLVVHDETDSGLAYLLAHMRQPEFPEALGVIYRNPDRHAYDELVRDQITEAISTQGDGDLQALVAEGDTWVVEDEPGGNGHA